MTWWETVEDGEKVFLTGPQCRELIARDRSAAMRRLPPDFPNPIYASDPHWRGVMEMAMTADADWGAIEINRAGQLGDGWHRTLAASLAGGAIFTVRIFQ
jgi:hypothetical protein